MPNNEVDEFLEHFGVKGMKWGKTSPESKDRLKDPRMSKEAAAKAGTTQSGKAKSTRTPMSKEKKAAIAVGVGAVAAIGIAVALKSMNKNMDLPVSQIASSASSKLGQNFLSSKTKPATALPASRPASGVGSGGLKLSPTPKAPSNYPMTPLRKTPVLDATLQKYDGNGNVKQTSPVGSSSAPSLATLNSIINSTPRLEFDQKTGQYVTR